CACAAIASVTWRAVAGGDCGSLGCGSPGARAAPRTSAAATAAGELRVGVHTIVQDGVDSVAAVASRELADTGGKPSVTPLAIAGLERILREGRRGVPAARAASATREDQRR